MAGKKKNENSVGIRNPFALAEVLQGKKINWARKSFDTKASILEDTFGVSYEVLFSSKKKSAIFNEKALEKAMKLWGFSLFPREFCTDPIKQVYIPPDKWATLPNSVYASEGMDYRQVVQGGVLENCWLIAALSSIAFKKSANTSIGVDQAGHPNYYSFRFYDYYPTNPATKHGYYQDTSGEVPLLNGSVMHCHHAKIPNDVWPALYEKAYYQWRENYAAKPDVPEDYHYASSIPDLSKFGRGNPFTALRHVTGSTSIFEQYLAKIAYDPEYVFREIYSACTKTYNKSADQKYIDYPAVAWTYDLAATGESLPGGAKYCTATVAENHTYSLLGVWGRPAYTPDKKYIVLRNPFGPACGDPTQPGLNTQDRWGDVKFADTTDGIFAISAAEFVKYFYAYGWAR